MMATTASGRLMPYSGASNGDDPADGVAGSPLKFTCGHRGQRPVSPGVLDLFSRPSSSSSDNAGGRNALHSASLALLLEDVLAIDDPPETEPLEVLALAGGADDDSGGPPQVTKAFRSSLQAGHRRQTPNKASSFIDASFLYGSSDEEARARRTGKNGRLDEAVVVAMSSSSSSSSAAAAPMQPTALVAALRRVWLRYHNSLAAKVIGGGRFTDDETAFARTRSMVRRAWQKIVEEELLPPLGIQIGPYSGHQAFASGALSDAFAAAFKTLVAVSSPEAVWRAPSFASLSSTGGCGLSQLASEGALNGSRLCEAQKETTAEAADDLIRAAILQPQRSVGLRLSDEARRFSAPTSALGFGGDAVGLSAVEAQLILPSPTTGSNGTSVVVRVPPFSPLMRSDAAALLAVSWVDTEVGSYQRIRDAYNLDPQILTFDQLLTVFTSSGGTAVEEQSRAALVAALKKAYGGSSTASADFAVLGLAEVELVGDRAGVAPFAAAESSFGKVLTTHFARCRDADRFWWQQTTTAAEVLTVLTPDETPSPTMQAVAEALAWTEADITAVKGMTMLDVLLASTAPSATSSSSTPSSLAADLQRAFLLHADDPGSSSVFLTPSAWRCSSEEMSTLVSQQLSTCEALFLERVQRDPLASCLTDSTGRSVSRTFCYLRHDGNIVGSISTFILLVVLILVSSSLTCFVVHRRKRRRSAAAAQQDKAAKDEVGGPLPVVTAFGDGAPLPSFLPRTPSLHLVSFAPSLSSSTGHNLALNACPAVLSSPALLAVLQWDDEAVIRGTYRCSLLRPRLSPLADRGNSDSNGKGQWGWHSAGTSQRAACQEGPATIDAAPVVAVLASAHLYILERSAGGGFALTDRIPLKKVLTAAAASSSSLPFPLLALAIDGRSTLLAYGPDPLHRRPPLGTCTSRGQSDLAAFADTLESLLVKEFSAIPAQAHSKLAPQHPPGTGISPKGSISHPPPPSSFSSFSSFAALPTATQTVLSQPNLHRHGSDGVSFLRGASVAGILDLLYSSFLEAHEESAGSLALVGEEATITALSSWGGGGGATSSFLDTRLKGVRQQSVLPPPSHLYGSTATATATATEGTAAGLPALSALSARTRLVYPTPPSSSALFSWSGAVESSKRRLDGLSTVTEGGSSCSSSSAPLAQAASSGEARALSALAALGAAGAMLQSPADPSAAIEPPESGALAAVLRQALVIKARRTSLASSGRAPSKRTASIRLSQQLADAAMGVEAPEMGATRGESTTGVSTSDSPIFSARRLIAAVADVGLTASIDGAQMERLLRLAAQRNASVQPSADDVHLSLPEATALLALLNGALPVEDAMRLMVREALERCWDAEQDDDAMASEAAGDAFEESKDDKPLARDEENNNLRDGFVRQTLVCLLREATNALPTSKPPGASSPLDEEKIQELATVIAARVRNEASTKETNEEQTKADIVARIADVLLSCRVVEDEATASVVPSLPETHRASSLPALLSSLSGHLRNASQAKTTLVASKPALRVTFDGASGDKDDLASWLASSVVVGSLPSPPPSTTNQPQPRSTSTAPPLAATMAISRSSSNGGEDTIRVHSTPHASSSPAAEAPAAHAAPSSAASSVKAQMVILSSPDPVVLPLTASTQLQPPPQLEPQKGRRSSWLQTWVRLFKARVLFLIFERSVLLCWSALLLLIALVIVIVEASENGARRQMLKQAFGPALLTARISAQLSLFALFVIIITRCRRFFTAVREHLPSFAVRALPLSELIVLHKAAGVCYALLAIVHTLAHLVNFSTAPRLSAVVVNNAFRLHFPTSSPVHGFWWWVFATLPGATGVLLLLIAIAFLPFSAEAVRRAAFAIFHRTHTFLYSLTLPLILVHGCASLIAPPNAWKYLVLPLSLYGLERLLALDARRNKVRVMAVQVLPGKAVRILLQRPRNFTFQSGQYVNVLFPALATEAHPLTIASPPQEKHICLMLRAVGPWTTRLRSLLIETAGAQEANRQRALMARGEKAGMQDSREIVAGTGLLDRPSSSSASSLSPSPTITALPSPPLLLSSSVKKARSGVVRRSRSFEPPCSVERNSPPLTIGSFIRSPPGPGATGAPDPEPLAAAFTPAVEKPQPRRQRSASTGDLAPSAALQQSGQLPAPSTREEVTVGANVEMPPAKASQDAGVKRGPQRARAFRVPLDPPFPSLVLEGPHGSPSQLWSRYKSVTLVCGGIGVTPMLSVLSDVLNRIKLRAFGFNAELKTKTVDFLWVARNLAEVSWLKRMALEVEAADRRQWHHLPRSSHAAGADAEADEEADEEAGSGAISIQLFVTAQREWKNAVAVRVASSHAEKKGQNEGDDDKGAEGTECHPFGPHDWDSADREEAAEGSTVEEARSRGPSPLLRFVVGPAGEERNAAPAAARREAMAVPVASIGGNAFVAAPVPAPSPTATQTESCNNAASVTAGAYNIVPSPLPSRAQGTQWSGKLLGFQRSTVVMGRPDFASLLSRIKRKHADAKAIGVFACGPSGLTAALSRAVRDLNAGSDGGSTGAEEKRGASAGPSLHYYEEQF